eukprot:2957251-Rhodomonas_salina.3
MPRQHRPLASRTTRGGRYLRSSLSFSRAGIQTSTDGSKLSPLVAATPMLTVDVACQIGRATVHKGRCYHLVSVLCFVAKPGRGIGNRNFSSRQRITNG